MLDSENTIQNAVNQEGCAATNALLKTFDTDKARLSRKIERATALYPKAIKIGVADGAHDNWDFLNKHTDKQTLDLYHATEY